MNDYGTPDLSAQLLNFVTLSGKQGVTQNDIYVRFSDEASSQAVDTAQTELIDSNLIVFTYGKWRLYEEAEKFEDEEGFSPKWKNIIKVAIPVVLSAWVAMYVLMNFMVFTS